MVSLVLYTSEAGTRDNIPFFATPPLIPILLNNIKDIDERIISDNTSILDQIFLYGNENYNHDTNKKILLSTINFCIDSKRFDISCYRLFFYVK